MNIQNMNADASTEIRVDVLQGEVYVTSNPQEVLSTILGSCVAVCMWDETARIGGMNHFLLPSRSGRNGDQIKYGANAMELLINGLLRGGATRTSMQCKLFGGASMGTHTSKIGEGNIAFARSFIRDEGIPCMAESLGGNEARRVRFWPTTGRAKLLIVPRIEEDLSDPVVCERGKAAPQGADITLF